MSKHTPGPWRAIGNEVHVGRWRICSSVCAGEKLNLGEAVLRERANARLIAAAPELLEALQEVFSLEVQLIRDIYGSEFVGKARAAIAKATSAEAPKA